MRDIRRNILNATLVTLSLGIGVMSVMVTHQLSVVIVERFSNVGVQGSYQQIIELKTRTESEYFELRKRWRQGELKNVSHMVPVIQGVMEVEGKIYDVLGFDPVAALPGNGTMQVGSPLNLDFFTKQAVLTSDTRLKDAPSLEDNVVIVDDSSAARQLLADLPTAQDLLNRANAVDAVWLRTTGTAQPIADRLWPGLMAAAQAPQQLIEAAGYQAIPFDWWNPSSQLGDAIVFNLGMLSLLTMLVAGFIVFQAIQSNLRHRDEQIRLLDTLGVSASDQRSLWILRCSIFGFSGCALGILMGFSILAILSDESLLETWETLNSIAIAKALTLGFGTALAVGVFTQNQRSRPSNRLVAWIATILALLGVAYGIWQGSGLLGASLLSVCFCVLSVFCIVPQAQLLIEKTIRRQQPRSFIMRMNLRNALRTATDIRLAINALAIAVATAIGIGLMLASFRAEFSALLDQRLSSDLHLADATTLDVIDLAAWDGVQSIRTYRRGKANINGVPVDLVAANLDEAESERYGYSLEVEQGIFVNELAARRHGWQTSQWISLQIGTHKPIELPILHVFKDYGEPANRVIVPNQLVGSITLIADRYSINTTQPSQTRAALTARYPNIRVTNSAEIRALAMQVFDASFATAQIMVYIAIFVAVIGMACALIGVQTQRVKEMRLLTMVGTSKPELIKSALIQNAFIGLFAVVVALPLSFAIAWNLCYLVNPRAYGWSFDLDLSLQPILLPCLLGIVAAILSGLEPLRRSLAKSITQPLSDVV